MSANSAPIILFIEDERDHFQLISNELAGYQCVCLDAKELHDVATKAKQLQPVAAVVDFILYTGDPKRATSELREDLETRSQSKTPVKGGSLVHSKEQGPVRSGLECIEILRQACPGIRIIECSMLLAGHAGAQSIAKITGPDGQLRNAAAIAASIREALSSPC